RGKNNNFIRSYDTNCIYLFDYQQNIIPKQTLIDGAIILGQTALELVYNWWIVENKQMIIGDDAKDLSAANKIRLIISQLQISSKVPKAFTKLQELMSKDAPEAIVGIRNSIVHSQAEKRSKLRSYDNIALYEALQVFIWYIELSLLNILKYEGKYFDRCFDSVWEGKSIRFVPWKNTFIPKIQS
ncbi:hypothetical protein, partial [Emticicia sp.]|uniref:hypothetical protein n=1 Tax=Emticicia sp. TaxID=1930953 RepID=UPI003750BC6D